MGCYQSEKNILKIVGWTKNTNLITKKVRKEILLLYSAFALNEMRESMEYMIKEMGINSINN